MHRDRALWVSLGVLALAVAAVALRETGGAGWMPGCQFRKWTGFECAGCGMTRAGHAALNGEFRQAFAFNPVGMVLLPVAGLAVLLETIGWVRGRPLPVRFHLGRWGAVAIVVILVGWWILRNFL